MQLHLLKKYLKNIFQFFILIALSCLSCSNNNSFKGIKINKDQIKIKVFGLFDPINECEIFAGENGRVNLDLHKIGVIKVNSKFIVKILNGSAVIIDSGKLTRFSHLKLITENQNDYYNSFYLSLLGRISRKYFGGLEISYNNGSLDLFVNQKPEDYVKCVLASESNDDEKEYLKALGIVIRTYTVSNIKGRHNNYDFCDNTHCQLFLGLDKMNSVFSDAVNETRNTVLSFNNEVIDAYYCGACGGNTFTPENIWKNYQSVYHYKSVECIYCANSKFYRWVTEINKDKIKNIFFENPYPEGICLKLNSEDSSPRTITVQNKINTIILPVDEFRLRIGRELGWNKIYSNNFILNDSLGKVIISGKGFGHNTGLCQSGAEIMSKNGFKSTDILSYYFPNTILQKIKFE